MEKKPAVTLPKNVYDIIMKDIETFEIKRNTIYNLIFENFFENDIQNTEKKLTELIRFEFNKKNIRRFEEYMKGKKFKSEAEELRKIFEKYVNLPQYQREKIIFREKIDIINRAIKERKKLKIYTYRGERIIKPFFIKNNKEEEFNYLICMKDGESEIINYRIMHIIELYMLNEKFDIGNDLEVKIKELEKNYDPFKSNNLKIKVFLSKEGIELLIRIVHNRPKLISHKNIKDIKVNELVEFECSEKKAFAYFIQFLDKVKIVEPESLKESFRESYKKAYQEYLV